MVHTPGWTPWVDPWVDLWVDAVAAWCMWLVHVVGSIGLFHWLVALIGYVVGACGWLNCVGSCGGFH